MNAPKVLVTGGAGFIGSHIAEILANMNYDVVVLDDFSGGFLDNVPMNTRLFQMSVTDHVALSRLFDNEKFDYVFHLAAYAAEGLSPFIRRFNYQNNLIGSVNLINLSVKHKIKCFVFTSSIAVYGRNTVPMLEMMHPTPADPYGVAKYAVEMDLQLAHEMFGLNYIIFRPHNVYGERQNIFDKYRNVIGIFMRLCLEGKPMTIFGDGKQERAFSYIQDVAPIIANSINNVSGAHNQIFNIGGEVPYTVNELADTVAAVMGVEKQVIHLAARHEPKIVYAGQEKLKKFFDVPEPTSLVSGVAKMAKWVQTVKLREVPQFAEIEITEGLPDGWF